MALNPFVSPCVSAKAYSDLYGRTYDPYELERRAKQQQMERDMAYATGMQWAITDGTAFDNSGEGFPADPPPKSRTMLMNLRDEVKEWCGGVLA